MFTGLIEETGTVAEITPDAVGSEGGKEGSREERGAGVESTNKSTARGGANDRSLRGIRFRIRCRRVLEDIQIGDSIAVSGACQTVENFDESSFTIFSIPETLAVTNFADLTIGSVVNLERALRLGDRLGGHWVQGHVEGTAVVKSITTGEKRDIILHYDSPYLIPKGSVTLNGISLTVMECLPGGDFRVQIIPETLRKTDVGLWRPGMRINIEVDYIIKSLDWVHRSRA